MSRRKKKKKKHSKPQAKLHAKHDLNPPKFAAGDRVRVKAGVIDPDYFDLPLGGWSGTVEEVERHKLGSTYLLHWTPETLASAHPVYQKRCRRDAADPKEFWAAEEDLEADPGGPLAMEQPTQIVTRPLDMTSDEDRVRAVFGLTSDDPLPGVISGTHKTYYEYLKAHLSFPFEARFDDRPYFRGSRAGSVHSVTVTGMFDEFPIDESEGAMCKAMGEGRDWELPLGKLDRPQGSANKQLIDDYLFWFHNYEWVSDAEEEDAEDGDEEEDEDSYEEDEDEDYDEEEYDDEGLDEHEDFGDDAGGEFDAEEEEEYAPPPPPAVSHRHLGRNDPCPCGSGKKFKKCCLGKQRVEQPVAEGGDVFESLKRIAHAPKAPAAPTDAAYQVKVSLQGSDPLIWRRLRLPDCTLETLHRVLQMAMGWGDEHLHAFQVGDTTYGVPPEGRYNLFDRTKDERSMTLGRLVDQGQKRFTYEYDFGDSWQHEIVIEETLPQDQSPAHPVCVEGQGACPPEDCGGVWGYEERLDAWRDPEHPEHEEAIERLGEDFDPDKFNCDEVNRWWAT